MSNINFDNPWLLLLGIPLLLLVAIPFRIAVHKENRNAHNTLSFICHVLIAVAVTLCAAGMNFDAMITKTQVYVLADVSYSADRNLDVVDGYVRAVEKSLPKNSEIGLVAFGRNYQVLSYLGEDLVSVKTADRVETDATDIATVMREVGNFFDEDVIKRIVVITDGVENAGNNNMASVVNKLQEENVYIDVIYLDDNLTDDVNEIQLSDVTYTASAFVGREEQAELLINCNNAGQTRVYVDVLCNGKTSSYPQTLNKGQNRISVPLNTDEAGKFKYTVTIRPESDADDTSAYNNTCLVTQSVSQEVNVLFIGGSQADQIAGMNIYGTENVDYVFEPENVPFTVEDLCRYDEIVLCNFDVRTMRNAQQFVSALDTAVSKFGKTLTTYGNTYVQETKTQPNDELTALGNMLPISVGNDQDGRVVAVLLDISLSMKQYNRKDIARAALEKILDSLSTNDRVMIVSCCGDPTVIWNTQYLTNKSAVLEAVDTWEVRNGTKLQVGLQSVYDQICNEKANYREVIILSDGEYHSDRENVSECVALAEKMSKENIVVSAFEIYRQHEYPLKLKNLVENRYANGKGFYKTISIQADIDYAIGGVVDDLTEVCIEGDTYPVTLLRPQEEVAQNVGTLAAVRGFWYGSNKSGVTSVLTARYHLDKVTTVEVPLYSYWSYGSGRVATYTSDISSVWTSDWTYEAGNGGGQFLKNIRTAMLPQEKTSSAFLISTETDGATTNITVSVSAFKNDAVLKMTLTDPMGGSQTKTMYFDTENYVCSFLTDAVGRYSLHLVYDQGSSHYEADRDFEISYYEEYDAFTSYNVASLYRIVSENGEVSLDGNLKMDNSESMTRSYTFSFTVPLMVFCAAAYVTDIIIRMLRWKDIRSVFVRERSGKQTNE